MGGDDHRDDRDGHGPGGQPVGCVGLLHFGHMVDVLVVVVVVVDGGGVDEAGVPVLRQLLQTQLLLQLILLCGNNMAALANAALNK